MADSPPDHNPYQAPTSDPAASSPQDSDSHSFGTSVGWVTIFFLNLPVPLWFGASMVTGAGTTGMVVCVLCLLSAGVLMSRRSPATMGVIAIGAVLTAISQFVPILHVIAGLIALEVARVVGVTPDAGFGSPREATFAGGFVITLVTGVVVLFVAAVIGTMFQFVRRLLRKT